MLAALRKVATMGILACAASGAVYANWTASGTFRYIDREFDQNGFTGVEPSLPIRSARVEVRDANANGNNALLASGVTDSSGNFSIAVSDTKTRTVYVRVLTTSTGVATLFLKVENTLTPKNPYAVAGSNVANHNPNTNVNFGTVTALIGSGGEPFNIYDQGLRAIDYFAALNGARPGSTNLLTLEWQPGTGAVSDYDYANKRVHVGDPSPYNDTVILHETGHYAYHLVSGQDNPGGTHHLTDCNQDIRLAYDEGRATWFGQSVRRFFSLPRPDLYVKTTGAPGPGNLDFYFNVETESPYYCDGAASEVAVYAALWDINDTSSTADGTPGVDDDTLSRPDGDNWDVDKNYVLTAVNRSLEDFWDGWFVRGKGFKSAMEATFDLTNVEFFQDSSEPNNSVATATFNGAGGNSVHLSFFADSNGDGVGETDNDYFSFSASAGTPYTIETLNLWGDANTSLELLDSNGITVLASNDDRSPGDASSLINYTPAGSGTLYVRSFHAPDFGVYGSYDFRISGSAPVDNDGDTYNSTVDCNDNDASIHPGAAEVCDGVDQDCDGIRDDGFPDVDADGWASCGGDCNDSNAAVHPGVPEICNGIDDNCAGGVDEGFDADSDGYTTCGGDCNDANAAVHPGVTEVCNGIDDNCAGGVDEGFDVDGDGYTTCGGDCNDSNPAIRPNAVENCGNGVDDNCNGLTDSQEPSCQVDTVVITKAEWKNAGRKLTVWATSTGAPQAVLTLVGYGTMTYDSANNRYTFVKNNTNNPGTVTVTSSQGGSDTETVTVL
jgi:hypothetical protein